MRRHAAIPLILAPLASILLSLSLNHITGQTTAKWSWILLFFFSVQAILVPLYQGKAQSKTFPSLLLTCIVLKLLLCLIFLLLLSLFSDSSRILSFHFLLQFVVFTLGEIFYVQRLVRRKE